MTDKKFGTFKCHHCGKVFFQKKKLEGHIGGAHRKNITQKTRLLNCKHCSKPLIKGKGGNWADWAIEQGNLICIHCKRKQNRESYRRKVAAKRQEKIDRLNSIKGNK